MRQNVWYRMQRTTCSIFICRDYLEALNGPTGVIVNEGGKLFLNVWTGVHCTHDRIVWQAGQDLRQLGTGSLTGED